MIKIPFADMAEIVNSLPSAELAYKSYVNGRSSHKLMNVTYTQRPKLSEIMKKGVDTPISCAHADLTFEASPISYKIFVWKLLTPVIVEG